jgi:hypothetical protein
MTLKMHGNVLIKNIGKNIDEDYYKKDVINVIEYHFEKGDIL